ncbi:MAG: chorismate synthase [Bacteroidales bacterium]|nr:chorismate synthase [Bacteroidales bacterium]
MNTFGKAFRLTTFGESHGKAIGGIIDGCPAGLKLDFDAIADAMSKRKPGNSPTTSQRKESDLPEFLSGINEDGITLGTPIGFIIRNENHRSEDYDDIKNVYRPNHADYTYERKYGIRDHRGGGRASARETACRVVAGAIASQILRLWGISIEVILESIGGQPVFSEKDILEIIEPVRREGDSVGGMVKGYIRGLPAGLGEPVYDKFQASLGAAMLSINGVKGFDYGLGMNSASAHGSETVDSFSRHESGIITETNFSGGVQGGITNGMPVFFHVAFKPTPSIMQPLHTLDKSGRETVIALRGRHDPCIAIRGRAVVEAMAALVTLDAILIARTSAPIFY